MKFKQWVGEQAADLVVHECPGLLGFRRKLADVYCWVIFRSTSKEDFFLARVGSSYMGTLELAWPFTPFTVTREFEVPGRPAWLDQLEEIFGATREQLLADAEVRKVISRAAAGGGRVDAGLLEQYEDEFVGYLAGYLDQTEKLERPPELDSFLEQLKSEGAKESEGAFTVDIRKAREKLREYQLASPAEFVVHLLAAGAAGRARQVEVHVDADDLIVELDVASLDEAELDALVGVLMQADLEPRTMMKQELVLALNSASQLGPRWLRLDSGAWRRDLTQGWDEPLQPLDPPVSGMRVHFRRPLGLEVVDRFLRALAREHPEFDVIRRRCPHLPMPVRMGDKELSSPIDCSAFGAVWYFIHPHCPLWLEGRAAHHFEFASPGPYSILVGLQGPSNDLVVQRNGLVYERPEVDSRLPFVVVEAPNLPTDLSHQKLVDSQVFQRFCKHLEEVEKQVIEQTVEELAQECRDQILAWAIQGVRAAQSVPCVPRLGSTPLSWRVFLGQSERERFYTTREWAHPPLPGDLIYSIAESNLKAVGRKLILTCADDRLEKAQQWWTRHQQWLELAPAPVALELPCLSTTRTELSDAVTLLMGLQQVKVPGALGSVLELRAQGRPLETIPDDLLPRGVAASVNDPELRMDSDWKHVERDETFDKVIANLQALLPELYRKAVQEHRDNPQLRIHLIYYAAFCLGRWHEMPPWYYEIKLFTLKNGRGLSLDELQRRMVHGSLELRKDPWTQPALDHLLKTLYR
ncbi:MAG: hypothetical protein AB7S38_28195 [Vulcanimicrobiota bacterium]